MFPGVCVYFYKMYIYNVSISKQYCMLQTRALWGESSKYALLLNYGYIGKNNISIQIYLFS